MAQPAVDIERKDSLELTEPSRPPVMQSLPIKSVQSETNLVSNQPRVDPLPNQNYVTRKDRLGLKPAWIDCDFCERCTKTRVQFAEVPNDNEGIMALLLCLVCPCLVYLAYSDDRGEEVSHYCTGEGCGKQVTYKRPEAPIQVLKPQPPNQEVSKYGVAAGS